MTVTMPINPVYITQVFGVNKADYIQFGLAGHNGWDLKTKWADTPNGKRPALAPQDAAFYKKGNEGDKGYGLYTEFTTKTSKSTFKHTFAHCDSLTVYTKLKRGQEVAITDNTGNSTAAHLHWTVKRLNADGSVKNYNNGFFGAINPQEYIDEVRADITNSNDTNMTELERKKVVQFDRAVIAISEIKNSDGSGKYIPNAASEQFFDNPQDDDKFTNLIKRLLRDANAPVADETAIRNDQKEKDRQKIIDTIEVVDL